MRRRDWLIGVMALALVGAGACVLFVRLVRTAPPRPPKDARRTTAQTYFDCLRDGKVEEAKRLVVFESAGVRKEWEREVNRYVRGLKAGRAKWRGDVVGVESIRGPAPGEWAAVEVQWRFHKSPGWVISPHYTYLMRTVNGQWRMVISQDMINRGIPFVPPGEPPGGL